MNPQRLEFMVQSVVRLVRRGATSNLLNIFEKNRPVEVAALLKNLPRPERRTAFIVLFHHDVAKAAEAITEIPDEVAVKLLETLEIDDLERVLGELTPDDAAVLVDALPEDRRDELLAKMEVPEKAEVEELLHFPSETAGRIMTPNVFAMNEDLTIGEAITEMQRGADDPEIPFYLYVVDGRKHLVGVANLRELMSRYLRAPNTKLRDFMRTDVISVRTSADQEEVARLVADYNLLAIPVVDDENKLAGQVTVDDVIDVIREEATEDLFALAGVDADDRALGDAPRSFTRRVPWLLVSLITAFISVFVIHQFEGTFQSLPFVAVLLPLVAAIGGHAATQTMTVIVRGISMGEVNSETRRRAFFKEVLVGLINGFVVGIIASVAVGLLVYMLKGQHFDQSLGYAGVVLLSMLFTLFIASIAGSLVPITLKRLNFDPAIASSVFVITITDVLGFLVFLKLASELVEPVG